MQETILYLVRHGQTDWNLQHRFQGREDVPLNETGLQQARRCGQALANLGIRMVAASPLRRAAVTGEVLASYTGAEHLVSDPDLIERDFGSASGKQVHSDAEYFSLLKGPGMEPVEEVGQRMQQALLRWNRTPGPVALISHGMAINVLLHHVSGGRVGLGKTILKNCCVNILRVRGNGLELLAYNLDPEEAAAFAIPQGA